MIDWCVDMRYLEENEDLDRVVLTDESGEHEDCVFVPIEDAPSDTSDGYHTFAELYDHRAALLVSTCNLIIAIAAMMRLGGNDNDALFARTVCKSRRHHDGSMYDGYFVVAINCSPDPTSADGYGDLWATWHCEDKWWDYFIVPEVERAPEFDGHTPKDALDRLLDATSPVSLRQRDGGDGA